MTLKNLSALVLLAAVGSSAMASNLVVNGDFQTGALAPSTTSYTLDNSMIPPATWNIVSFDTLHPSWVDLADHTTGDAQAGRYMIVNGTDAGLGPAWAQVVSVTPNTDYTLSAWFASLFPQSPASLQFQISGVSDGEFDLAASPIFSAPVATGTWAQSSFVFNSGSTTSVRIQIWDVNQAFTGNDYAIDDISLQVVPAPGAAALLGIGGLVASRRRRQA